MKPSPELLYEYKQARRQAIEDCRRRTEKVRSELPRLGEIAEQKRDIAYNMGREILEKGEIYKIKRNKVRVSNIHKKMLLAFFYS